MPTTYSERRRLAFAISASSSLSKTTCVTPPRSRTSMKSNPPRSRTRCTHPSSTTSAPTSLGRSAPQVCVRVRSPNCSATLPQFLENGAARGGLIVGCLCLGSQVLDRERPRPDLIASEDRDERNPQRISVLYLLANLVGIRIDQDAQPGLP